MKRRQNLTLQKESLRGTRERWRASGRHLSAWAIAITASSVLCLTSCASSRKQVETERTMVAEADSTVVEVRTVSVESVPMSVVSMEISMDSVLALPAGASYSEKSGRASVKVSRGKEAGTVVVYATCDSLERMVEYYERRAEGYKAQLAALSEKKEEKIEPKQGLWAVIIAMIAGMAAGIGIMTTIKTKKE